MQAALLLVSLSVAAVPSAELRSEGQQAAFGAMATSKAARLAADMNDGVLPPDFPRPSVTSSEATCAIAAEVELAASATADVDEGRRHLKTAWHLYLTHVIRFGEQPRADGEMAACMEATAATVPRAEHPTHATDDAVRLLLQGQRDEARAALETNVDCKLFGCGNACASAQFDRALALMTLEIIEGDLAAALAAARRAERTRGVAWDTHQLEFAFMDVARCTLYSGLDEPDAAWEVYRKAEETFARALAPPVADTFDWRLYVELVPVLEALAAQLGETRR